MESAVLGLLFGVIGVIGFKILQRKCWFCHQKTLKVTKSDGVLHCLCRNCGNQYKIKKGELDVERPEMYNIPLNEIQDSYIKDEYRLYKAANGLCRTCNNHQTIIVRLLADLDPSMSENQLSMYKISLERRYPLCINCQYIVQKTLDEKVNKLRSEFLETSRSKEVQVMPVVKSYEIVFFALRIFHLFYFDGILNAILSFVLMLYKPIPPFNRRMHKLSSNKKLIALYVIIDGIVLALRILKVKMEYQISDQIVIVVSLVLASFPLFVHWYARKQSNLFQTAFKKVKPVLETSNDEISLDEMNLDLQSTRKRLANTGYSSKPADSTIVPHFHGSFLEGTALSGLETEFGKVKITDDKQYKLNLNILLSLSALVLRVVNEFKVYSTKVYVAQILLLLVQSYRLKRFGPLVLSLLVTRLVLLFTSYLLVRSILIIANSGCDDFYECEVELAETITAFDGKKTLYCIDVLLQIAWLVSSN